MKVLISILLTIILVSCGKEPPVATGPVPFALTGATWTNTGDSEKVEMTFTESTVRVHSLDLSGNTTSDITMPAGFLSEGFILVGDLGNKNSYFYYSNLSSSSVNINGSQYTR